MQDIEHDIEIDLGANSILMRAGLVLVILPTLLGILVAGPNVPGMDIRVSRWIQQWQGSIPEALQRFGDNVGGTVSAITALIVCLAVTLIAGWRRDTAFVLIVAVFRLVGFALKDIYNSPRPTEDLVRLVRHYNHTGYPSGHSMTMAMMATTVVFLVWRQVDSIAIRVGTIVIGALLTLLVGWSRIWAGAHWPSDVLGGWMYGLGFALLAAWIAYRPRRSNTANQIANNPAR